MKQRWDHSLLFLTTIAIFAIAVVMGALFIDFTNRVTYERIQQQSAARMGELLDTVENTVASACLTGDQVLAQKVADGLLKHPGVQGVVIRNNQRELAHVYRDIDNAAIVETPPNARMVRVIHSRVKTGKVVGEILLDPDRHELERRVDKEVHFVGQLLGVQIAGTSIAIFMVLLIWIVRPIKALSDNLHGMDAAAGDRLRIPFGHGDTEIGRLTNDINALAARLVSSLEVEHKLRKQHEIGEKKYHAIFENAETGIFIANREGVIESYNSALTYTLGFSSDAQNKTDGKYLSHLAWRNPEHLDRLLADCIDSKSTVSTDLELINEGGAERWLNLLCSPVGDGKIQGLVSDVSERKRAENSVRLQVITDSLTGIANRHGLEQVLQKCINKHGAESGTGFAMMLINLDAFKRVNEALGLPVGDNVLKVAAQRLRSCLAPGDAVARIGGDEFAVVFPLTKEPERVVAIGKHIIAALNESYEVLDTPIQLGASIGVTFYPSDGKDLPTLLRNAELALSSAKAGGGNRCEFFTVGMIEEAEHRRTLETDMHLALRQNEFCLFYQPIVDVISNRVVGAETLIRWHHPLNGLVQPDTFIPLAEETGFIREIGFWVLETACKQLAQWQLEGKDYYLSINISGRQIAGGLAPKILADTVQRFGVRPERLVLEITEGVLLTDVSQALSWLNEVREQGFRIYLDDFGTGYSSLSYLKRFPVHTVKIDKSFVRDMSTDSSDLALVEAIIAMAHSLGLEVVAEGVENLAQLQLLKQKKCRSIQGYYLSRPVLAEEFDATAKRIAEILGSIEAAV